VRALQLRTSLSLAYTAILSFVLITLALGFRYVLVRQLDAAQTEVLEEKARALHRFLLFRDGVPVVSFDAADPEEAVFVADATRYYQVFDANGGRLLVQSPGMEAAGLHYSPAEVSELRKKETPHDVSTDSGRLRVSSSIIRPSPGEAYLVQVGEPLTSVDAALTRFDRVLWFGMVGGLLIAALLGRWLAGRALAPLSRLAAATQSIGIRTLHDRLEIRGTGDELDRVATAFNQTLTRLEASVGEMRQFSTALAHELRTPIAILRGEAELELAHPVPADERRDRIASQIEEYDRLTRLIGQILTLARAEAGEIALTFSPVALGTLAASVAEQIEPVAQAKNLVLATDVERQVEVRGDAGWLDRLLLILLDNAINFTPPGGHVTIRVSGTVGDARLSVSDTGIGIPSDALPHVFDRFYRVESQASQAPGAGLGLALAQWIAVRHGGCIDVTSVQGEGATFVVTMPRLP